MLISISHFRRWWILGTVGWGVFGLFRVDGGRIISLLVMVVDVGFILLWLPFSYFNYFNWTVFIHSIRSSITDTRLINLSPANNYPGTLPYLSISSHTLSYTSSTLLTSLFQSISTHILKDYNVSSIISIARTNLLVIKIIYLLACCVKWNISGSFITSRLVTLLGASLLIAIYWTVFIVFFG